MRTLHFTFSTGLAFSGPVTGHQLALRCLPMQDAVQTVQSAALTLTPAAPQNRQTDGFGNPVVWTGIPEPHTGLTYQSSGVVQVDLSRSPLAPPPNPVLSFPGALTRPGERLRTVYEGLRPAMSAAHPLPVLGGWIYETLQYVPGATGMRTTAEQALAGGAGILMVDTGELEDVRRCVSALKSTGRQNGVQVAFAGNVHLTDIPNLAEQGIDILFIGKEIVDAKLLDLKLDVLQEE